MQVKSFTYTKKDGSTSRRVVMVTRQPSNMLMGVDISELDKESADEYVIAHSRILDSYMAAMKELDATYDVRNRVRQFDPLKMTEITEEWISYEEAAAS